MILDKPVGATDSSVKTILQTSVLTGGELEMKRVVCIGAFPMEIQKATLAVLLLWLLLLSCLSFAAITSCLSLQIVKTSFLDIVS